MFKFLKRLLGGPGRGELAPPRFGLADVSRRLGLSVAELQAVRIEYASFAIPKRGGGAREILAPAPQLKQVQRRIHRRLLRRLRAHPHATGFERGHSIVSNAFPHAGKDVVIRLDLKDFFGSIKVDCVQRYFRFIGYDDEAAGLLTRLCTHEGALPAGAPTSPRLSNLVNYKLDARLAALAAARGLSYSRYADDITFSARQADVDAAERAAGKPEGCGTSTYRVNDVIHGAKRILKEEGYRLHMRRKLRIYRRHQRQVVTGLVVNVKPALPRSTRRRLRAIEHHLRTGRPATLDTQQLAGWIALKRMIGVEPPRDEAGLNIRRGPG